MNDSASNLNHKQANTTMHYSFIITIIVVLKIIGYFTFFTLAAL